MPKRIVFFFIGFVVLASLAYYGFNRWKGSREKVDLWALVPDNAAFIVETNDHLALLDHLQETALWESFETLGVTKHLQDNLAYLDSIAPGNQRLARFLNQKNILTSLHVVGKTDLEFVYYIPVNSVGEHRFLRTLTENLIKSELYEEESREYRGILLTEVKNTRLTTTLTYFTHHNNIIVSPSPVLIEEIVRRISKGKRSSVAANFRSTNYLDQPDVYANVFINYRELPNVLGLFLDKELMPQVRYLSSLCHNGMLELKLEKDKIFLNGFSEPETMKRSMHRNISPVKPQPLNVKNYLPNRTAFMLHFGLEEIARLRRQYLKREAAGSTYGALVDSLASTFNKEVALAYMESSSMSTSPEKVVYARSGNPAKTLKFLKSLNKHVSNAKNKKPFTEQYGSYSIQLINVPQLPTKLFGTLFSGFEQSYVVQVDDYIIISDEMSALRSILDDISAESVWGKSVAQKSFLEETLQEANFSVYLNTVNAWYILSRYMINDSREDLLQNATLIKRFNQVSLQFSNVDGQYYTNFVFRKQDRGTSLGEESFVTDLIMPFDTRIKTRPYPVQNAVDRSKEIVVQDSSNVLINITASGKRGWVDTLTTSVRGGIKQIEFGPDKKLHYLFATANRLYAINNQGKDIDNFPFNLGDSLNIRHLAVFDYEKDGNYRLLADDNLGNLYMYDIRGNAIDGWQPRRMDYRLASEPQHLRIDGKDIILVFLENGYVYALNRDGNTYPGFPISLKSPLISGAIVKSGSDLRRTEVTAVTKYGNVMTFNLLGQVLQREQLLRPSKSAFFELVQESSNGRSFVIVRQDQGKVAVFDQDLNQLFEKRYVTSAPKIIQYFNFGGDNKIFAITETGPQKAFLYNIRGKLIGNTTLESSQPISIYYNEVANNYSLHKVFGKELKKITFRLPG